MNRMKKLMLLLLPLLMLCSCAPDTAEKPEPTMVAAAETQPAVTATVMPEPTEISTAEPQSTAVITPETQQQKVEPTLKLTINSTPVTVQWEENESVTALMELVRKAPLTIRMSMYGGFEQVGSLGTSLPRNDVQTTTQAGDIVLYSGSNIVIFYGSNSWSYTRLGHIEGLSSDRLTELLSGGDVMITLK